LQRERDFGRIRDFDDVDGEGTAEACATRPGRRNAWSSGGYQLAKEPSQISALDVISAIDGPVLITSCVTNHGNCDATDRCSVREPLRRVNESILHVLGAVTISQMSEDPQEPALVALSAASRPLVSTT
jgi:hypothetical protein